MSATRLPLKALSTNALYIGRKVKSKAAREFETAIAHLLAVLKPTPPPAEGDLTLHFRFGTTRKQDTSNCVKLAEDCIARHFGINDRRFVGHTAVRVPVKKGGEFILFEILPYRDSDFPTLIASEKPSNIARNLKKS